MPRCIYCLEDSTGAVGVAHVLPEAVAKNDLTLPRGAVCDGCNNYLGKLDATLVSHPMVAAGIQVLRLPGKADRVRKVLGNVGRGEVPNAVTIPTEPPEYRYEKGGRTWRVSPLVPEGFEEFRFRRSLYHVAMNAVAWKDGVDRVLDSSFDPIRRYVRYANRREAWPFAQLMLLPRLSPDLRIELIRPESTLIVAMRLVAVIFWVDVFNSKTFESLVEREKSSAPDLRFVPASQRLPKADPTKHDGKKYRIEIFDE